MNLFDNAPGDDEEWVSYMNLFDNAPGDDEEWVSYAAVTESHDSNTTYYQQFAFGFACTAGLFLALKACNTKKTEQTETIQPFNRVM